MIHRDVLRGILTEARAAALIDGLVNWPLSVAQSAPLLRDAWTMRNNITIHDGLYVALARHLGATLVTADQKLAKAPGLGALILAP
ncbi:type II toxin-antitoxin system VapC family toxin [Jiangella muralis]|uniref:type II toxin-antitoxin system VapC family toxin n=1 Tax=Jiangella muralis TaxID=702383 RepID=UPI00069D8AE5|nr:type II toxin-antitoxin system VapC family toxin [Jiangella muralis]